MKNYLFALLGLLIFSGVTAQNSKKEDLLIEAVRKSDLKKVKSLIDEGVSVNCRDWNDGALIHIAAEKPKDFDILKLLVKKNANVFSTATGFEMTALQIAIENNNQKAVKLLQEKEDYEIKKFANKTKKHNSELILKGTVPLVATFSRNPKLEKEKWYKSENIGTFSLNKQLQEKVNNQQFVMYLRAYNHYSPKHIPHSKITTEEANIKLGLEGGNYPDDISAIRFWDKWNFDENNFSLTKDVKAYIPVRQFKELTYGEVINKQASTFTLIYEDYKTEKEKQNDRAEMVLFKKVEYKFYFGNIEQSLYLDEEYYAIEDMYYIEKDDSPNWTRLQQDRFKRMIIDNVINGKRVAYNYNSKQEVAISQIRERMGERIDTITDIDDEGNPIEVTSKRSADYSEVKAVIFKENWYINPKTLRIRKEIIAVSPVRFFYEDQDLERSDLKETVLYTLYF